MASQSKRFWERPIARYGLAVLATGAAVVLRYLLSGTLGQGNLYITFYPAVMVAAVIGGFGPGILATLLCALVVDYWLIPPIGLFAMTSAGVDVSLILFVLMGVFMSGVAKLYHRTRERLADYERETALCESEGRYRELVQNANSAIMRWSQNGTITFFNEYAQQFFGYTEQEVVGKNVAILVPAMESDGADLSTLVKDILANPERYTNHVNENLLRDGTRVWMAWTNRPILDANGQISEVLAVGTDITGRKRAEQALQKSEERLRFALETSHIGAWDLDLVAHSTHRSLEHDRIFGYQSLQPEWTYEMFLEHVLPEDRAEVDSKFKHAVETHTDWNFECRICRADDEVRWIWAAGSNRDSAEGAHRLAGIVQDITDRKRAEREVRELEAHKREFYRRTILAATEGKLIISEPEEIKELTGTLLGAWEIGSLRDVGLVRSEATSLAREAGMDESRVYDVTGCVVESAANAIKHAGGGRAALYKRADSVLFVVSDSGSGIGALRLPDVALTKGYTTAGTLGMGYKVMISFADKVYLATGPQGTTVATELRLHVSPEERAAVPSYLSAW